MVKSSAQIQPTPTFLTNTTNSNDNNNNDESERLSSDLALFLSNPTLRKSLANGSLDLASYSQTIEAELELLEADCISIYRENSSTIASLRVEMDECDVVLAGLQELLLGFQADLGGLSGDIKALQEQSRTLGVQLRNRRDAEMGLRRFLERVVIPPNLADIICSGDIDATFLQCVQDLETKYQYLHLNPNNGTDTNNNIDEQLLQHQQTLLATTSCGLPPLSLPSGLELQTHISKLRLRAVSRTRSYFLHTISELRRPKTNIRIIQINALLKYAPLADFLLEASPRIYAEVRDVYVESMGKTLHALFRTYAAQLGLLDSRLCGRGDVIAVEESSLRDVFSSKVDMRKRGDAFCLGERGAVLEYGTSNGSGNGGATTNRGQRGNEPSSSSSSSSSAMTTPILAHVALAEGLTFPYEVIFKSIMMHLMDAATNEYIFIRQFFKENGPPTFQPIFHHTLNLILEQLENCLFHCYDCLGLLLMIKLTHANRRIMKQRKVESLDSFFVQITNLLWPRLKTIVDKQIRSVRDGDAKKLGVTELHAHYVSRRYAEFTCSILQILNKGQRNSGGGGGMGGSGGGEDSRGGATVSDSSKAYIKHNSSNTTNRGSAGDMLLNDITLLLDETVLLIERLADGHSTNKKKIVFLINNIDSIISIFQERRVSGRELNRFVDLLMQQRELFVEEELLQSFSKMIAFVQQTELHMHRPQYSNSNKNNAQSSSSASAKASAKAALMEDTKLEVNPQVVEALVREFSSTWKQGIEQVNRNVLSFFANFRNGMEILKQVLTQLLLYYTRFQDIIRKVWRSKPPAFCKDLVSTSTILIEIKKHALAI